MAVSYGAQPGRPRWIQAGRGETAYGAGGALEHGHLGGGALPLVGGDDGLEDLAGNVPEAIVLVANEPVPTGQLSASNGLSVTLSAVRESDGACIGSADSVPIEFFVDGD